MKMAIMSEEYRINTAILEVRIVQLDRLLAETRQPELRRRLQRRIGRLHAMAGEGRRAAFDLAHYYDKDKGGARPRSRGHGG